MRDVILIVGLGNVGKDYTHTRHNVGFMCLDKMTHVISLNERERKIALLDREYRYANLHFDTSKVLKSLHSVVDAQKLLDILPFYPHILQESILFHKGSNDIEHEFYKKLSTIGNNCSILFVAPTTFMNRSGEALLEIKKRFTIRKSIVIYDDLDTRFGSVSIKEGGSSGGHNGVKSIDSLFGKEYVKIKIGIGANPLLYQVTDEVARIFSEVLVDRLNIHNIFKSNTLFNVLRSRLEFSMDISTFHTYPKSANKDTSSYVLSNFNRNELLLLNPILEYISVVVALLSFEVLYAKDTTPLHIFNIPMK